MKKIEIEIERLSATKRKFFLFAGLESFFKNMTEYFKITLPLMAGQWDVHGGVGGGGLH